MLSQTLLPRRFPRPGPFREEPRPTATMQTAVVCLSWLTNVEVRININPQNIALMKV